MHIVHITSELAPIAKVGGLGDVVHGLSKEIIKLHHTVDIILPKYDCLHYGELKNLKVECRDIWSLEGSQRYHNTIWSATTDGLKVYLIEPHHPRYYFSRGTIYGCTDDSDRFYYFSRVALEFLQKTERRPDVIHLHDWPTAIVAPLYKEVFAPKGFHVGGVVLTLHNLEYQGKCASYHLTQLGMRPDAFLTADKLADPKEPTLVNTLKGGIIYSDAITTVSPTYEKEILTPQGGFGLEQVLIQNQSKLTGILNGIDEDTWNPAKDPYLIKQYSTHPPDNLDAILAAKAENRAYVRTHLGLTHEDHPLVVSITRLATQKGPSLIKSALLRTLDKKGQFVCLGSSAPPVIAQQFMNLQAELARNNSVYIKLERDETLAHILYAAADMIVIPSIFEPCGLTQMIAMRYGTIPIVRATGGLADTVFDIDTSNRPLKERNGFTFDYPDEKGVYWALDRALKCWYEDKKKWKEIMLHGMNQDYSWAHSAPSYLKIYSELSSEMKKAQGFA